jgi:hemerythrin-like domain-containing protein
VLVSLGKRQNSGELVDLLLECHGRIRQFVKLARHTGEGRGLPAADVVEACRRVERYFIEALPLHVRDEEESILPRLSGRSAELDLALHAMRDQHQAHESLLVELLSACRTVREAPTDAGDKVALADTAQRLEQAFEPHLALEETLIFPALRTLLVDAERASIQVEMRARREQP